MLWAAEQHPHCDPLRLLPNKAGGFVTQPDGEILRASLDSISITHTHTQEGGGRETGREREKARKQDDSEEASEEMDR